MTVIHPKPSRSRPADPLAAYARGAGVTVELLEALERLVYMKPDWRGAVADDLILDVLTLARERLRAKSG